MSWHNKSTCRYPQMQKLINVHILLDIYVRICYN
nr:MAG TPA: hypothetical protein [Caudoviricetes sp.]DAQ06789.1 MAG TPA: hypothetical protein [Caudoviricetes sp.]